MQIDPSGTPEQAVRFTASPSLTSDCLETGLSPNQKLTIWLDWLTRKLSRSAHSGPNAEVIGSHSLACLSTWDLGV